MRAKITSAALEVLAENGYAATTFTDVADRAGASRGALLYYFPQKPDLALGALEDGAVVLLRDLRARVATSQQRPDRDERVFDDINEIFRGSLFQAFLAVQVHARTDAALNARLARLVVQIVADIHAVALAAWGEDLARHPEWPAFGRLINDIGRGIALSSDARSSDSDEEVWAMARRMLLRELAALRASLAHP
jgi:AcrR family transcriptional regulator